MERAEPNTRCRVCIDKDPNSPTRGEHIECKEIFLKATPESVKFKRMKKGGLMVKVFVSQTFEQKRRIMLVCPECLAYTVY